MWLMPSGIMVRVSLHVFGSNGFCVLLVRPNDNANISVEPLTRL